MFLNFVGIIIVLGEIGNLQEKEEKKQKHCLLFVLLQRSLGVFKIDFENNQTIIAFSIENVTKLNKKLDKILSLFIIRSIILIVIFFMT